MRCTRMVRPSSGQQWLRGMSREVGTSLTNHLLASVDLEKKTPSNCKQLVYKNHSNMYVQYIYILQYI